MSCDVYVCGLLSVGHLPAFPISFTEAKSEGTEESWWFTSLRDFTLIIYLTTAEVEEALRLKST